MSTIDFLEKQYSHAFDMLKFGETKNTVLIAFNGAIIVGISKLFENLNNDIIYYFLIYAISMCSVSVFICFASLMAKIKHKTNDIAIYKSENLLFYATIANMTHTELIDKINSQYNCESKNINHELDLAKQAIITSQIAMRKFKLFNKAISFTLAGLLTPLSLLIYKSYLNHDR